MQLAKNYHVVNVFAAGPLGGNPAPIVVEATGMSHAEMQTIARISGHESGFVLPAPAGSGCDIALRFWVPNHEMSMCGHATLGAVWLLDHLGMLGKSEIKIWTQSGVVTAIFATDQTTGGRYVEISQPVARIHALRDPEIFEKEILSVLGISSNELAKLPIQNASTSRVKTLIPLKTVDVLNGLKPDYRRIERLCDAIGSTGLYPYAAERTDASRFYARQFPKSSGYPEDAATGIAASALAFGLLGNGLVDPMAPTVRIHQGWAMGRPSEILVRFQSEAGNVVGCWLGGQVKFARA